LVWLAALLLIAAPVASTESIDHPATPLCALADQPNLLRAGTVIRDFDGDGETETLTIEVLDDAPLEEAINRPIRATLRIGEAETVFESGFNDGVPLYVADLDDGVPGSDICLMDTNTDPSGVLCLYRYDGNTIFRYTDIVYAYGQTIAYDGHGKIYYAALLSDGLSYVAFDCRTKETTRLSGWSEEFLLRDEL
jgi:hypothetical protein